VSEANEPGSESGKRSDDRRGAARGTRAGSWSPQEGGASNHLAARLPPRSPGSFAAAAMVTRAASWHDGPHFAASLATSSIARAIGMWTTPVARSSQP